MQDADCQSTMISLITQEMLHVTTVQQSHLAFSLSHSLPWLSPLPLFTPIQRLPFTWLQELVLRTEWCNKKTIHSQLTLPASTCVAANTYAQSVVISLFGFGFIDHTSNLRSSFYFVLLLRTTNTPSHLSPHCTKRLAQSAAGPRRRPSDITQGRRPFHPTDPTGVWLASTPATCTHIWSSPPTRASEPRHLGRQGEHVRPPRTCQFGTRSRDPELSFSSPTSLAGLGPNSAQACRAEPAAPHVAVA